MEIFITNGYSGTKLASINQYQLFLRVIHLSNVTTGDGERIYDNIFRGNKHEYLSSTYERPIQGTPEKSDWIEWRRAIVSTFLYNC